MGIGDFEGTSFLLYSISLAAYRRLLYKNREVCIIMICLGR